MATGVLVQLSVSKGGMPKLPVLFARVSKVGVEGDWQKNRKISRRARSRGLPFSEELYNELRDAGIDLVPGSVGENFTTLRRRSPKAREG